MNLATVNWRGLRDKIEAWRNDPVQYVIDSYQKDPAGKTFEVDEPQKKMLRALRDHNKVATKSCHGIGKSTDAIWAATWWVNTRKPALVVITAQSWATLGNRLWSTMRLWATNWIFRDEWDFLEREARPKTDDKYERVARRIVLQTSDKAVNVEGFHSDNLLLIFDEAKGIGDDIREAFRGALTQPNCKQLVLSTPPMAPVGWFVRTFKTPGWKTFTFSHKDSNLVDPSYEKEMAQDYGVNSPIYQARVMGEIPTGSAENVIHADWVLAAQDLIPPDPPDMRPPVVTCDVASTGLDLATIGRIYNRKFEIREWQARTEDLMKLAWDCRRHVLDLPTKDPKKRKQAKVLVIDDNALGGGVTARLFEMQRDGDFPKDCRIVGIKAGRLAVNSDRFESLGDELWWTTREALSNGVLILPSDTELAELNLPRGNDLIAQLLAPIYEENPKTNKIRVFATKHIGVTASERIRELAKDLPSKSPDLAHALIFGVPYWLNLAQEKPEPKTLYELETARLHKAMMKKVKARQLSQGEGSELLPL